MDNEFLSVLITDKTSVWFFWGVNVTCDRDYEYFHNRSQGLTCDETRVDYVVFSVFSFLSLVKFNWNDVESYFEFF